ncbi:MAG: 2-oxo acid dehydrogenase subunit, partial [Flavisolibacter sp.]|nr:2-oxo acid dehydrogenase subunit [Flavisolibacter sp.]
MATVDLVMPKMGESIMEATILKWHKKAGDFIKVDETLLEIATDKVDSEIPSTTEGVVEELLFNVNDVVAVGTVIARIKNGGDSSQAGVQSSSPSAETSHTISQQSNFEPTGYSQQREQTVAAETPTSKSQIPNQNRFYSPLVLNIAAQEGVSMTELENMPGTGAEGRVSKKDILQFVSDKRAGKIQESGVRSQELGGQNKEQQEMVIPMNKVEQKSEPQANQLTTYTGNVEIIEMDRMRRLIADHMVRSKHTSPHVTSFTEADVTNLVQWREKVKKDFEKREGTKITFTPLFIEAIVRCIKRFPLINSSVDGTRIIVKKDINIGMAAALPTGNLIVPVIKNADGYNLVGLAKQVNNMADAARNNKLKPEDISDGTFTLTNVGTFGSLMGTPIINQPQVAILAVGAIKKRPVVIETPSGDSIAIRHMMYLSMSYD